MAYDGLWWWPDDLALCWSVLCPTQIILLTVVAVLSEPKQTPCPLLRRIQLSFNSLLLAISHVSSQHCFACSVLPCWTASREFLSLVGYWLVWASTPTTILAAAVKQFPFLSSFIFLCGQAEKNWRTQY